jgi:hypothetical protein
MIDIENLKMIKLRYENIFILDDKYVISKSNNITQSDLKPKPDYFATLGLIVFGIMLVVFVGFMYVMVKYNRYVMVSIILFQAYLLFRASILYRLSGRAVIYKKDIIRIYINEKRNCIVIKFKEGKKRVKIKSMGLPLDINEKEKVLQILYENNLIGREYISQIIKMKEGFLYIKDKFVSFVDFKLYSKHVDAKRYKNEMYQLFAFVSFASVASIVMAILLYTEIYCLITGIIVAPISIVYLRKLYKQFVKSKTFFIQKDKIAGFSVNDSDNQKLKIRYYNRNRQLQQKMLVLSETAPEKNNVEFIKKYFPDTPLIS